MKIKNIAAICKKNKSVVLFERHNDEGDVILQYIGAAARYIRLSGFPCLTKKAF